MISLNIFANLKCKKVYPLFIYEWFAVAVSFESIVSIVPIAIVLVIKKGIKAFADAEQHSYVNDRQDQRLYKI